MRAYNFGGCKRNFHEILPGDLVRSSGDNVDTNFARGAPTTFGRAKRPNFKGED